MAEKYHEIDELFKEKLASHTVAPSPMAWEKLQNRLSSEKKDSIPWLRLAAAVLLLLGLSSLLWQESRIHPVELEPLAAIEVDDNPIQADEQPIQEKEAFLTIAPASPGQRKVEASPANKRPAKKSVQQREAQDVVAGPEGLEAENLPVKRVDPLEVPLLNPTLSLTENNLELPPTGSPQGVEYKITIISNGVRYTSEKETLVEEIENKIGQIGGLISKVDQGFADLQDVKNNWFASITTKK